LQVTLATRVLTDGFDNNKSIVISHLRHWNASEAINLLHQIVQGKVGTEIDPPKVWDDEPGIRFTALLSLAQRGEKIDDEEWDECSKQAVRPQDHAAMEIAGYLIDKRSEIQLQHFRFESYTLGEAAIEALSRSPGPRSLGLLVDGGMKHPWAAVKDQVEVEVKRMIGRSWERHERLRKIDEWLGTHSNAWIKPTSVSR